jgi:crotonobetainyl-CoA:carnitine CoA-transferase CaiB-like acyl-CoA transferase
MKARSSDAPLLLNGVDVVDACRRPSGAYCALLFAQAGAHVHRFCTGESGPIDDPVTDAFLGAGKAMITVASLAEPAARDRLRAATVVLAEPEFPWQLVTADRDGAPITVTIEPFGAGPYGDWVGGELVYASLGGATSYTRSRSGVPMYGCGNRYQYLAGLYAFIAAVAALGDEAVPIDPLPWIRVSNLEAVVSLLPYPTTQFAYNGTVLTSESGGLRFVTACVDGWVVTYVGGPWRKTATLLGRDDLVDDPRFVSEGVRFEHADVIASLVVAWTAERTVADALAAAERVSVAMAPVMSPGELLADEQLAARDAWEDVSAGSLGSGRAPRGAPIFDGRRLARPAAGGAAA